MGGAKVVLGSQTLLYLGGVSCRARDRVFGVSLCLPFSLVSQNAKSHIHILGKGSTWHTASFSEIYFYA
jgi:hypothetical protein